MINILVRDHSDDVCTIGRWMIDGVQECFTLEDPVRKFPNKIAKKTAIWGDRMYYVQVDYSPKFGRDMIHVMDVPLFTGIRVHPGKNADWTEGCVVVGEHRLGHTISLDPGVEIRLKEKIKIAQDRGEPIMLYVINPIEPLKAAA